MKKLTSVFIYLLLVIPSQAGTIYVDANATGANNGSSWEDAYNYLQNALTAAEPNTDIWVAQGTYRPDEDSGHPAGTNNRDATFHLKNGAALYGGFPTGGGLWENRDPNTYVTSLSGDINVPDNNSDNSYHVVTGSGTNSTAILDGFTITEGNANGSSSNKYGAGMYNSSGNPTVTNCTFTDNSASHQGGGMYNYSSSNPTVINCTFSSNSADDGGGMRNSDSSPTVTNCTFSENSAFDNGGGMGNYSSSPAVTNCTFNGNSAYNGGGMFNHHSSNPTITNCTFTGNSANESAGGGIDNYSSSPTVTNCTFSGNSALAGGGMYNFDSSSPTITNCTFGSNSALLGGGGMGNYYSSPTLANCIFWGNTATNWSQIYNRSPSTAAVSFSDVQGGWSGLGNIDTDPCFIEPGYWADANDPNIIVEPNDPNAVWLDGDYHLLPASPCINAGDPNFIPEPNETDLDGLPRIIGGRIDMGAYEFNHQPVAVAGPNQIVYAWINGFADVNLDASASFDDDNDVLDYYWSWTIDGNTYEANDITPTIRLPVGKHTIELVVDDRIDLSEPDYCTITVIKAVRGRLMLSPRVIETKSCGRRILATLFIPPVPGEKVNTDEPLRLYPGGIKAKYQHFYRYGMSRCAPTFAFAYFDKQMVSDALGPGQFDVSVVGKFLSGRFFFGSDTIKIISPKPKPPHRWPW